jgi:hypothetical protein
VRAQADHQHRNQQVVATPHQRHGDRRGDDDTTDDAAAGRLPIFIRFRDIKNAGIAGSWTQLNRLIDVDGFPAGFLLSQNVRAWRLADVTAWLANRPIERKLVACNRTVPDTA